MPITTLLLAILLTIPLIPATTPTTTAMDPRSSSKYMQLPALLQDLQIYQGFTFITFGIQFWEHLLTFRFELDIYTRRLPWRHGMIAYIVIRYSTWASLIPTLINICTQHEIDCQAALNALLVPLSMAIIMTSLIFIIRCIAVWEKNVWVTALLGSLWLAEAVMQLSSPFRMRSQWMQGACQTWFTTAVWKFNFAYLLAECTDIVTFALAAWKLRGMRTMGLGKVLFQQSVFYIGISTALNTICLTLIYLDLSPVLSYLCSPFAMTISGILACRAFRDLQLAGHRGSPDLCFIKSNGMVWGTRDAGQGGPGPGGARQIEPDDEGYDAHEIIGCPTHGPQSTHRRGHLLSGSIDASTGRRLGTRPSKEDWVTRSGLGEPIFRHRQSQQFQPSPELPLPATAPLDVGISSTQTTFLGFLLGEEQAAFDSAAHERRMQQHAQALRRPDSTHKMNIIIDSSSRSGTTHEKSDKDTTSDAEMVNGPRCMRYESDDALNSATTGATKWSPASGTPSTHGTTTSSATVTAPTSSGGGMLSKLAKYSLPTFDGVLRGDETKHTAHTHRRAACHSDPPSPIAAPTPVPATLPTPRGLSERQRQRQRRVGLHSGDGTDGRKKSTPSADELHDSATSFLSFPEADFDDATPVHEDTTRTGTAERCTSPLSINTVTSGATPTSPSPAYMLDHQHTVTRALPSLPPPPRHGHSHGSPSRKSVQAQQKTSTSSRPCTADGASDIVLHEPVGGSAGARP